MYDKEKGIYPQGQYLTGRDLPLGGYILTPKEGKTGNLMIYKSYDDFINEGDEIRWDTFDEEFRLLNAEDREIHSYDEAIEQLKRFLHIRISWLDSNIETLRQYSVESKVKKYNETVN